MFQSTKVLELGSCTFRQPRASHSHCRFIHGYKLSAKFWFESKELDIHNWVVDFGGLKGLKEIVRDQFDHTTCIAADDPALPVFEELVKQDACDLRVMPDGTGVERIAEWCYFAANKFVAGMTENRCKCVKVEIFEHENNSAIYSESTVGFPERASKLKQTEFDFESTPGLTKPPFYKLDQGDPDHPGAVSEEVVSEEKPKAPPAPPKDDPLYPNKTTNKWIDPDKVKKKNSWAF